MKFDHIGIACENIDEMIKKIQNYMNVSNVSKIVYDKLQDANLCMIETDNLKIELISGNVVKNILKRHNYLYHTCYTVKNIDETMNKLINDGALLISDKKEAILFNNRKVSFLACDLGIIELLEEENNVNI